MVWVWVALLPQCGVFCGQSVAVVFSVDGPGVQLGVVVLQLQDLFHPGQVDPFIHQVGNSS